MNTKNTLTQAVSFILSALLLGFLVPLIVGLFICLTTDYTFEQCITLNIVFWIASILGCSISVTYLIETEATY